MDGWMNGWVDEWMDGWVDGWINYEPKQLVNTMRASIEKLEFLFRAPRFAKNITYLFVD